MFICWSRLCFPSLPHATFCFLHSASDDRHGGALSNVWISVPARTWREWLRSSHRSNCPTLAEDLSFPLLHHGVLLQPQLQVRQTFEKNARLKSCTTTLTERLFCSVAALKLQPRIKYWQHSNDDPSYCFGSKMGLMVHPIRRPINTDDAWDAVKQHSVMTRAASTEILTDFNFFF